MSIKPSFKHGIGRLVAAAEGTGSMARNTRLTQVSHKAPMRLVPVWKSSIEQAGAAVCALSNYGGGMLQGDSVELHVGVKADARLGVTTQGASRIYTQRTPNICEATLDAHVDKNGLLVWAPDPCSLFQSSSFRQVQQFQIDRSSSVALIDWFSSGRYRNGEHWAFDQLSTRTCLSFVDEELPFIQDAMHMDLKGTRNRVDGTSLTDPLGVSNFHAFASMILYGDQVEAVTEKSLALADALMAGHTRIRQRNPFEEMNDDFRGDEDLVDQLQLAGRVCMGVSPVNLNGAKEGSSGGEEQAYVVRLAATTNEDLYRIFHHCLSPLQPRFGMSFYKDRIRAKASEIAAATVPELPPLPDESAASIHSVVTPVAALKSTSNSADVSHPSKTKPKREQETDSFAFNNQPNRNLWSAYMLADSALPTGSFAHSAGLEVASQMGLLSTNTSTNVNNSLELQDFVQAATLSAMQQTAPFLEAGLEWYQQSHQKTTEVAWKEWHKLGQQAQAALVSNAPACAASVDQGTSLARVGHLWLTQELEARKSSLESVQDDESIAQLEQLVYCLQTNTTSSSSSSSSASHKRSETSSPLHLGLVLGALASPMGVPNIETILELYGYCAARDIVSAAVRLNLIGPLASIQTLHQAQRGAKEGWESYQRQRADWLERHSSDNDDTNNSVDPISLAAASAPIIEALHPCHEGLKVRLFRS